MIKQYTASRISQGNALFPPTITVSKDAFDLIIGNCPSWCEATVKDKKIILIRAWIILQDKDCGR